MTSWSNFFWRFCVPLVKFSYRSNFHVNIITRVKTIFLYKGLTMTRKLEKPAPEFCPISTISFIILSDFWVFCQIFLSPQVKRWVIVSYKHGIYELSHELTNNLRLRKLRNIRKWSKLHRMILYCPVSLPKCNFC